MYLKKLELFGFKSFDDRTALTFQPGMTAVVGPNGCGKSNVVDAFKWILGEQSAKGLRGSEMKDVIFSGTQRRKPSGYAEVTIVFDNEDRYLDVDYAEVAVTRRLYRSGDSEYQINKQKCRLKDIKGLFVGTGVGRSSYSIFEQGKIDLLLNASSLDRRIIIEEAAGVSKYRAKREETLRALMRVEDNLTRLNDIIEEVEKRAQRVKAQARKARRYRMLSERLKELRLRSAIEDYRSSVYSTEEVFFRLYWSDFQLKRLDEGLAALRARAAEEEAERKVHQQRLGQLREDVEGERIQRERIRERIDNGQRRAAELVAEREGKTNELESTGVAVKELRFQLSQETEELAGIQGRIEESRTALGQLTEARASVRDERAKAQATLQQTKEEAVGLLQRRSEISNSLSQLDTEIRNLQAREDRLKTAADAFRVQLEEERKKEKEATGAREELNTAAHRLEEQRRAEEAAMESLQGAADELESRYASNQKELQHCVSRREVLETLEERLEGVGKGVADILRRFESAEDQRIPVAQMHGLVASVVDVDSRYARAVEAALGPRAQALVVETQQGALELLELAREEGAGAVEIACLDRVSSIPAEYFPRHGGVLGRLLDHVQVREGLQDVVERLLANVVLVEDLPTAVALSRNGLRPFRLVTLQGELIEPWGGISLPGQNDLGLLSRRSELQELEDAITRLGAEASQLEAKIEEVRGQLVAGRQAVDRVREEAVAASRSLVEVEGRLGESRREIERIDREVAVGAREADDLRREREGGLSEKAIQETALTALAEEERACEQRVAAVQEELALAEDRVTEAEEAANQAQLQLVQIEKREEALREILARQSRVLTEREKHLEELKAGLVALEERQHDVEESVRSSREELEQVVEREATLREVLDAEEEADREVEQRLQLFAQHVDNIRREHGRVSQGRESAQLRVQEETYRRNHLAERLDEEYGIDLARLLERESEVLAASRKLTQESVEGEENVTTESGGEPRDASGDEVNDDSSAASQEAGGAEEAVGEEDPYEKVGIVGEERYLLPDPEWDREGAREELKELQDKIRKLGNVNLEALDELDELEERYRFQKSQRADLLASERDLRGIMTELNTTCRERFLETFEKVQEHFSELFRKCFGGGKAELLLEEGVDVLEAGVEIVARPPGKKISSLSLMSGGEKTMTTIALLFALSRTRPSPFCILDEVDAPLDEQNVRRFVVLLQDFIQETQFIVITHNKITMAEASTLYGITMQERGVSTRVSVELESFDPEDMEKSMKLEV